MTKQTYEAPAVAVLGSFEEITKASNVGSYIDGTYPVHTPVAGHTS